MPAPLGFASFGEINVRTYASVRGGKPGVWFFSLDAADPGAVEIARRAVHLPYYRARITTSCDAGGAAYAGQRTDRRAPAARFAAQAAFAGAERYAARGTLEHFLVERYCFYTVDPRGRTVRGDVAHEPWPLRDARASIETNTLLAAAGIEPLAAQPLVHASAGVHARVDAAARRLARDKRGGVASGEHARRRRTNTSARTPTRRRRHPAGGTARPGRRRVHHTLAPRLRAMDRSCVESAGAAVAFALYARTRAYIDAALMR